MEMLHRISSTYRQALAGIVIAAVLSAVSGGQAKASEINTGYFGSVAIQGYDPVAYFTEGRPIKGSEAHSHTWLGASWHFSSEENRRLFAKSPQTYAPQYGGHCATGLAIHGNLTKDIDPEAWAIIDNKLYLNYSKETNLLLLEEVVTIDKADANWKKAQKATH